MLKVQIPRVLIIDEKNQKLISKEVIDVFLDYEDELKQLFTIYDQDNIVQNYIVNILYQLINY
jgi:hypothetical protein